MAYGIHWEWRGFGAVSAALALRFATLQEVVYDGQAVEDVYFWAPGLEVNLKTRAGVEGDLKIKRPLDKDGPLECWREDPGEIFNFPLSDGQWSCLGDVLAGADLVLGAPPADAGPAQTTAALKVAGCTTLGVSKLRQARLWPGRYGPVLIEWTRIDAPQRLVSIGLETTEAYQRRNEMLAKAGLRAAIEAFGLDQEPLAVMNYRDAAGQWANGQLI
ncbi:MAG: hypothetical protein ACK2UK_21185 [Candidatus Promineifilaceae bacterium]